MIPTIEWHGNHVRMIDQRKIPGRTEWFTCRGYRDVIRGIQTMVIRGAPAIGVAAAMGLALGAQSIRSKTHTTFIEKFKENAKVKLICGDSGEKINDILSQVNEPVTFWLDSHFSTSDLYKAPLVDSCPILRELEAIKVQYQDLVLLTVQVAQMLKQPAFSHSCHAEQIQKAIPSLHILRNETDVCLAVGELFR